jgi:hypothetical protein
LKAFPLQKINGVQKTPFLFPCNFLNALIPFIKSQGGANKSVTSSKAFADFRMISAPKSLANPLLGLEGTTMQDSLSSTFKALAVPASSHTDHQVTTTIRKIIREHEKTFGLRTSLKKTRRAVKELVDEGYFKTMPEPPHRAQISPFNRPFVLAATQKGLDHLAALDVGDGSDEKLEPQLSLVMGTGSGIPIDLPKADPASMVLNAKPQAIIHTLASTCDHFGKLYCYPSQETIQERCGEWYGVKMSNRTLNRWLDWLEAAGWIRRTHRHRRKADGTWEYRSTLYELCSKVFLWIKKSLTRLRKFAAFLGLPQMADKPSLNKRISPGGSPSTGAKPPGSEHNSAPTASRSYEELAKLKPSDFKSLVASLAR